MPRKTYRPEEIIASCVRQRPYLARAVVKLQ
jgi:hypothetical protein